MPRLSYLNVDLEIRSKRQLSTLVAELRNKLCVLYSGPTPGGHLAALEVCGMASDANATIRAFCKQIKQLSPRATCLWKVARERTFDIGFEVASAPEMGRVVVAADTVRRISDLGANLVITLHSPRRQARGIQAPQTKRARTRRRQGRG